MQPICLFPKRLRNYALGVAYLLFCWTFIPSVIGLIEGISYLIMTDEAFDGKCNVPTATER